MAYLQDVSCLILPESSQASHGRVLTVRRSAPCKSAPPSSSWLLAACSGTSGKVGGGVYWSPPCRSSHLPCSFLTQCLEPGPRRQVLLSPLPLLLCFCLFWVYCQEAGAVGSQCLRWRDNRVLRLPCWGAGQPLGAAPLPPSSGWPLLARVSAFGFAQFLESRLPSRGIQGWCQRGPSTLPCPYLSAGTLSG